MAAQTQEILDLLSYIRAYAPNFPSEDQTDVAAEFAKLLDLLGTVLKRTKDGKRKWWLELSIREAEQALAAYESGDEKAGSRSLDSAEDYLENSISGKRVGPTFIAGPDGTEGV